MSDPGSSGVPGESPESPGIESGVDPLIGQVIGERYRIDQRLGVGGMGAVYRAEHVLMRKPVAVKVLHREMTLLEEVVKRFEREAIAAGRIDHPNVAVATDFGKLAGGAFYLVLEYVPGKSLTDVMTAGPMPAERALFIARQVASALGAAHAAEIVHRDLKPDNVMLIEKGGTKDFVKVLDFGIAKVAEVDGPGGSPLTRVGSVFGTPAYMAPEQAAGQNVDGRADLYSLGLMLYEMLAGRPVFDGDDMVALLAKQLTEPPPPLPEVVPPDVAALVLRLLEKDPGARHQTAAELVAAIDGVFGPPPTSDVSIASQPTRSMPSLVIATAKTAVLPPPEAPPKWAAITRRLSPLLSRFAGGESVVVMGRTVPLWLLGAAVGSVFMVLVLVLGLTRESRTHEPAAPAKAPPPAPELGPVIARAATGDRAAIEQLEARSQKGRTAAEWMGIGKGHARLLELAPALSAYERAVLADPELANDPDLLKDVRRAIDDEKAQKLALDLARGPLGAPGADLLFDVYASTTEKNQTTTLAKSLLDREDVRAHASPALRLALDLRRTKKCEEVKRLLAGAKDVADERSARPLTQLMSRGGCGFLGLGDCYSCLRGEDVDLSDIHKAAQSRKAPEF